MQEKYVRDLLAGLPSWIHQGGALGTLVSVAIVLSAGLVVALLGRIVTSQLASRLARHLARWGQLDTPDSHDRLGRTTGAIVYWGILLVSFMAAAEVVGLPVVTQWLGKAAAYFPRLISAVLIVGFGLLGAKVVGQVALRASTSAGLPGAKRIRRAVEAMVVFACIVVAIEQVGIEISFLKSFFIVLFAMALGAAALAFGLGSRDVIADVLSIHFLRRQYREGQKVRCGDVEGTILRFLETSVVIENAEGQVRMPGRKLSQEVSLLVTSGGGE